MDRYGGGNRQRERTGGGCGADVIWLLMENQLRVFLFIFFFFQAEDGIRDRTVTGVQTCALPICTWPDNALKVRTKDKFPKNQWLHLLVTYDGSAKAAGLKVYVNGRSRDVEIEKDKLTETIANNEPLRIGARNGEATIKGLVDDVRFYQRTLSAEDARLLAFNGYVPIIAKSRGNRTDDERNDLQRFYKESYAVDYLRSET